MLKTNVTIAACATLLWAGMALATAQQSCDQARVTAWGKYVACVDAVVAQDASGVSFDYDHVPFTRCRHTYFKNWTAFQSKASLATSTCALGLSNRYTDNGDQTVTDNLSGLVWEKKDNLDATENPSDPHDANNYYLWSNPTNGNGLEGTMKEDGAAFTDFLGTLNGGGFGGSNGWRIPTLAELQSIIPDFKCTGPIATAVLEGKCNCHLNPCVAFDAANTELDSYWTATSYVSDPSFVWGVEFFADGAPVRYGSKVGEAHVRAVRGGL